MKSVRLTCAAVALGVTVVGIVWLTSLRADMLVFSQPDSFAPKIPAAYLLSPAGAALVAQQGSVVQTPVWWSAYAEAILLILGVAVARRFLDTRLRPVQRTAQVLLRDFSPELARFRPILRKAARGVLGGLDWLVAEPLRLLIK